MIVQSRLFQNIINSLSSNIEYILRFSKESDLLDSSILEPPTLVMF